MYVQIVSSFFIFVYFSHVVAICNFVQHLYLTSIFHCYPLALVQYFSPLICSRKPPLLCHQQRNQRKFSVTHESLSQIILYLLDKRPGIISSLRLERCDPFLSSLFFFCLQLILPHFQSTIKTRSFSVERLQRN